VSAPFTVEAEKLDDGIRAFTLAGELDHATAPELRGPLDSAIEEGIKCVLIDLSDCTFIDSTGLSVIVHAHSALNGDDRSGQLEICCPDPQVRRLLEITGVDRALGLHQTRDEALEALKAATG
jgi:stage II sporulation protein AA (anti-sigma F factor antagonist)